MLIVEESNLSKLGDLGFSPKYNEDTGDITRYVIPGEFVAIRKTFNYLGGHRVDPVWAMELGNYANTTNALDVIYNVVNAGILKQILKIEDLNPAEPEEPTPEQPSNPEEGETVNGDNN